MVKNIKGFRKLSDKITGHYEAIVIHSAKVIITDFKSKYRSLKTLLAVSLVTKSCLSLL